MRIKEFFDKELKEYSIDSCKRAIPLAYDGLKVSQRKAIFGMLQRGENAPSLQVERLVGYCASVSKYHHGGGSMAGAIIGMAQDFTGANNINWFTPESQFGTRLAPEASSSRYIFTKLDENFRKIFLKEDDIILKQMEDEGTLIEPETYVPILPGSMINGSQGMGTGFATKMLMYNPADLIDSVEKVLAGKKIIDFLTPWYRGFKGKIERNKEAPLQTIFYGHYDIVDSNTILVDELPIGWDQESYLKYLNVLLEKGWIKDYDDGSTEEIGFHFTLDVSRDKTKLPHEELMNKLNLISRDSENFTLWTGGNKLRVYENTRAIIQDFVEWRLLRYEERRQERLRLLGIDIERLDHRIRFITEYIKNNWSLEFSKKNKKDIVSFLNSQGFEDTEDLLSIKIYNLTKEEIEKLEKRNKDLRAERDLLLSQTAKDLYLIDLKELKAKV